MSASVVIDRRARNLALLVAGCFFMEILDATIVVTAIPQISDALGVPDASAGLTITAYLLTVAALIPCSAWMTARYGPRRVFIAAIVLFTVASLGCALATSLETLVAWRIAQGAGGALMVPVGRIVVFGEAPKAHLMRLMAYIVWPGLIAPVFAPLLGGVITTYVGWRGLFLVNLPLGLVALVVAWRLVHGGPAPAVPRLDRLGVVLTASGLAALTYAAHLVSEPAPQWSAVGVIGVVGAVLVALAVLHLLRAQAPLLNLGTLRIRTFAAATSGSAMHWLVVGAIPFLLPLLFQTVFGWSAIKSGAVVLLLFAGNACVKPATTWLYTRFGFRTMLLAATGGLAVTTAALGFVQADTPLAVLAPLLVLSGVARSVGLTGYATLSLSDVPSAQMADANALSATVSQLFAGLGVALGTLALGAADLLERFLPGPVDGGVRFRVAFVLLAVVAVGAAANALRLHPLAGAAVIARPRSKAVSG